ncbi:MAG: EAL domain-containing protein [Acidimicrobiia bacterium]
MQRVSYRGGRHAIPWLVAYLATGVAVAFLQPQHGQAPWYPPTAIGIALFLFCGRRWWPAVLGCELVISYLQYRTAGPAVVSASVTTLEELLAASLLLHWGLRPALRAAEDVVKLLLAALAMAVAGALVGVPLVRALDFAPATPWSMLRVWSVGELTGVMALLPVLLLLFHEPRRIRERLGGLPLARAVLLLALTLLSIVPTALVFARIGPGSVEFDDIGTVMLLPLPLLWVALRFGRYRASLVALTVNVAALAALGIGDGTRVVNTADYTSAQLFMFVVTLVVLFTAVTVDAQREASAFEHLLLDRTPLAVIAIDLDARVTMWNGTATEMFGWRPDEVLGAHLPIILPSDRAEWSARIEDPAPYVLERRYLCKDGSTRSGRVHAAPLRNATGQLIGRFALIEDDRELRLANFQRDLVSSAMGQAAESIFVAAPDGTLQYTNLALAELTGRDFADLGEINVTDLGLYEEGADGPSGASIATIDRTWTGTLVAHDAAGGAHTVEASVTPIRSTSGVIQAYVGVMRDMSRELRLEADLAREQAERAALTDAFASVHTGLTPERTALGLCRAAMRVDGLDGAVVLRRTPDGVLTALGAELPPGSDVVPGTMAPDVSALVLGRAASGPFVFDWSEPAWSGPVVDALAARGLTALGGAPIVWDGQLRGVFLCGTNRSDGAMWLGASNTLGEIASHAAALLGPQLARLDVGETEYGRIRTVIDEERFHPVYQPVFHLFSRGIVGYEALTRFDDGTRPDLAFAAAHAVGLGHELEEACARKAIAGASPLPDGCWLSVNLSPSFVLAGLAGAVLADAPRPLVIEVTEHVAVDDYGALRQCLDSVHGVRLAVDDAGAGYASLHHVVELRPDFVKLDIALTRGVEADQARQAMIAGMRHFAAETATQLIAEGIETEDEADTMRRLGVELGQGYLLGRPAPAADWV